MSALRWVEIRSEPMGRFDLRADQEVMGDLFSLGQCVQGLNGWSAKVWGPRWEEPGRTFETLDKAKAHVRRRVEAQLAGGDDLRAGFKVAQ